VVACGNGTGTRLASAGTVSVTGGSIQVTLAPQGGMYNGGLPDLVDNVDWSAGTALTFAATGGDIPAFSVVVTTPGDTTLTSPTGDIMVDPSHDLSFAWSPATDAFHVQVRNFGVTPGYAICTFPAGTTSGAIPVDALMMLPKGPAQVIASSFSEQSTSAGDWSLQLRATASSSVFGATIL
jgi:hypothetical protein